jgi:hypothetical protein
MGRQVATVALLVCTVVLHARPADAQETSADALAVRANEVHQTWCADIYGAEISAAAAGYREVSEVWAVVDVSLQDAANAPLIYWRGVLAQCLGQDDRAAEDLILFLEMLEAGDRVDREALAAMEEDARRRAAIIEQRLSRGGTLPEVSVLRRRRNAGAVVLSAGATVAGIGFAVNAAVYHEYIDTTDADTYDRAAGVSQACLAVGIAGAVASAVGLILVIAPASETARVSLGPGPWVSLEVSF